MLHSFLLHHSGAKSLVRSHFGFSFSDVAGDTHYTKMHSKVWGEIYPAFFFSLREFSHCGNKEVGNFFFCLIYIFLKMQRNWKISPNFRSHKIEKIEKNL
jgi:hypothetical protein